MQPRVSEAARLFLVAAFLVLVAQGPTLSGRQSQTAITVVGGGVCTTCTDTNKQADKQVTQGKTDPNVAETGECTKEKKAQMTPEELQKKCPASKEGTTTFTDENGKQVQVSSGGGGGPVSQGSGGSTNPSAASQYAAADGKPAISQVPLTPPDAYTSKAIEDAFPGVSEGAAKLAYPISPPASTGNGLNDIVNGPASSIPGTELDYSRPPSVSLTQAVLSDRSSLSPSVNGGDLGSIPSYIPPSPGSSGFSSQPGSAGTGFVIDGVPVGGYPGTYSPSDIFMDSPAPVKSYALSGSDFPIRVVDPSGNTIATLNGEDYGITDKGGITITAEQLHGMQLGSGSLADRITNTLSNEFQDAGTNGELIRQYLTDVNPETGRTAAQDIGTALAANEENKAWYTQLADSWRNGGGNPRMSVEGTFQSDEIGSVPFKGTEYVQGPGMAVAQERSQGILNQENPDITAMGTQGLTGSQSGLRTNGTLNQNNETISSAQRSGPQGTQSGPGRPLIMNRDNPLFAAWDQKGLPGTQSGITERSPESQPISISDVQIVSASEFAKMYPNARVATNVEVPPLQTTDVRTVPEVPGSTPYAPVDRTTVAQADTKSGDTPAVTAPKQEVTPVSQRSTDTARPQTPKNTGSTGATGSASPAAPAPTAKPGTAAPIPTVSDAGPTASVGSNAAPSETAPSMPSLPSPSTSRPASAAQAPSFMPSVLASESPSSFQVPLPSQGCSSDYCPPAISSVAFMPSAPALDDSLAPAPAPTEVKAVDVVETQSPERKVAKTLTGKASCYDPTDSTSCGGTGVEGGMKTATGDYVGDKKPTAALRLDIAKDLGCGIAGKKCEALVTVTSGPNAGKAVNVTIDDNGPLPKGRIVDLSSKAKELLGGGGGLANVKVEIYSKDNKTAVATAESKASAKKTAEAKPNCNLLSGRAKFTCLYGDPMGLGGPTPSDTIASETISGSSGADVIRGGAGNDNLGGVQSEVETALTTLKQAAADGQAAKDAFDRKGGLAAAKLGASGAHTLADAARKVAQDPNVSKARKQALEDSAAKMEQIAEKIVVQVPKIGLFSDAGVSDLKEDMQKAVVETLTHIKGASDAIAKKGTESTPPVAKAAPSTKTGSAAPAPRSAAAPAVPAGPVPRIADPAQEDRAIRAQAVPAKNVSPARVSVADVEGPSFARALVVKINESLQAMQGGVGSSPITPAEVLGIFKQETNDLTIYERSNVGAQGIAQMMPPNGRQAIDEIFSGRAPKQVRDTLSSRYGSPAGLWKAIQAADPRDAWRASVDAGVAYLATVRDIYKANTPAARARIYNGGPSQRDVATKSQTQDYWQKTAQHMRDIVQGAADKYRSAWNQFAQAVRGGVLNGAVGQVPDGQTMSGDASKTFRVTIGGKQGAPVRQQAQSIPVCIGSSACTGINEKNYINSLCQPDRGCAAKSLGAQPDPKFSERAMTDDAERAQEYAREVAAAGAASKGNQPVLVDNCQYSGACPEILKAMSDWNAAHPDKTLIPMVNNPLLVGEKLGKAAAQALGKMASDMKGGIIMEPGSGTIEQHDAFRKAVGNAMLPILAVGTGPQMQALAQEIASKALQNIGTSISSATEGAAGYRDAIAGLPVAVGVPSTVERALSRFAENLAASGVPAGDPQEVATQLTAQAKEVVHRAFQTDFLNSSDKLAGIRGDGSLEVRPEGAVYRVDRAGQETQVGSIRHVSGAVPSAPAPTRITGTNIGGINPVIARSMEEASRLLPAGYTAKVISASRNPGESHVGSRSLHIQRDAQGKSLAVDVQITDPNGAVLKNIRAPQNFGIYRDFMQNVKAYQDKMFPQLASRGRWGGYFVSGDSQDLMHYDLGPKDVTAAGNWEQGLNRMYAYYGMPGDVGAGMGSISTYKIPDPASIVPAEFDEFTSTDGSVRVALPTAVDEGTVKVTPQKDENGDTTYELEYTPPAPPPVPAADSPISQAMAAARSVMASAQQQMQNMFKQLQNMFGGGGRGSKGGGSGGGSGSKPGGTGGQPQPIPLPPPTQPAGAMRLSCTPDTVVNGSPATPLTISWQCPTGTRSTGTGFSTLGAQTGSATLTVSTSSAIILYKLECAGTKTESTTCSVKVKHPRVVLVAKPTDIAAGKSAEFEWSSTDVDSCRLYAPPAVLVAAGGGTGRATSLPFSRSAEFKIVCATGAATTSASATVHVEGDSQPPLQTQLP